MRGARPSHLRTKLLFPLFLVCVALLVGRLYGIQIASHERLVELARRQSETTVTLPAKRGTIFDCTGRPLAISVSTPSVFADPGLVAVPAKARRWLPEVLGVPPKTFQTFLAQRPDVLDAVNDPTLKSVIGATRELSRFLKVSEESLLARLRVAAIRRIDETARQVAPILDLPQDELRRILMRNTRFVWLRRPVPDEVAQRIEALGLRGVCVEQEQRRAEESTKGLEIGQWLGFVGNEGHGINGLEMAFERRLRGAPGLTRLDRDGRGRRITYSADPLVPPKHGCDLHLTIDARVQEIVDRELARICAQSSPVSASAIVMVPSTGAIMAMGSAPGLDLTARGMLSPDELNLRSRNHPVQSVYEYGSTFKPFVAASVIELGLATPETQVHCENGVWRFRGRVLHDTHPHGTIPLTDVIVYSSNIGAAKLGLLLGDERLRHWVDRFHFGKKYGISLPAEEPGIVTPGSRWSYWTTTSVPMGQEIAGTPLQLITAFCALINGGELMEPHIVRAIHDPNTGEPARPRSPRRIARVISPATSATIRQMLAQVVERGTGKVLRSSRYPIGGKTGTAQKRDASGGYSREKFVSSFVGFAPVDAPRICVLVMVDEPHGSYYGAQVAAPPVGRIIDDTLATLDLAPPEGPRGTSIIVSRADTRTPERVREETP